MDLHIDGLPATTDDLAHQALVNYGAYTSFRVEAGGVRGLDRHLQRLDNAAVELFGEAVGEAGLRNLMRGALGDRADAWLRVSLFSPELSMRAVEWTGRPRVMVGVFPPPPPLAQSLRLQVQTYVREAPHLKHVATFGLMRARRAARAAGYDDALFVDERGKVSEGSLWNIGFVRGDIVTWPLAPMLAGVTQRLVADRLADVGLKGVTEVVSIDDLHRFDTAFICNSATPACAVTAIGERDMMTSPDLIQRLQRAWASNVVQAI